VAELHKDFIRQHGAAVLGEDSAGVEPTAQAFATFVQCIDRWRIIPYLDPGLPATFLPKDWPGAEGTALFKRIMDAYAQPSSEFVRRTLGSDVAVAAP